MGCDDLNGLAKTLWHARRWAADAEPACTVQSVSVYISINAPQRKHTEWTETDWNTSVLQPRMPYPAQPSGECGSKLVA